MIRLLSLTLALLLSTAVPTLAQDCDPSPPPSAKPST